MKKRSVFTLLAFVLFAGALSFGQCLPVVKNGQPFSPGPGDAPDYFGCANYANSPLPLRSCSDANHTACFGDIECAALVDAATNGPATCSGPIVSDPAKPKGLRKFVDTLPGLGPAGANNLGQYIPVAVADTTTYPGADYYEIAVVEYAEQMHSDLPATKLRGYVQLETPVNAAIGKHYDLGGGVLAVDKPHYLGPVISATKDRPVRILFRNLLPTGQGGNLFLPVDTTVMGSGMGPNMGGMADPDPQKPMCGEVPKPAGCYTENRATLHLHGGITPWISDGTPHQWVTPATENTPYPKGVSVSNVPDMPDPGPGAMTFFYTNQQSARLMFYHDHAWGITRLNVYAGEAAGYLITDPTEQDLIAKGVIPADQIPLIIQDKTFVPSQEQLKVEDPTWDTSRWGGPGSVWSPHVYMPAQNPADQTGTNAFGRWAYGPWFWPPTTSLAHPPIPNPYFDPTCNQNGADGMWCQPDLVPGTPFVSMGMEAFNDTPLVNGTAYPKVTLAPKPYRLRILNAANDRFFNLQLYVADSSGKEVALNPAEVQAALADPTVFPTPDTAISPPGPNWIQIGTEGGFLPAPVVIPPQPITWVTDPTVFNAGNVDKHSLLLGPAERADVIVDLSAFAGKTLILYNDAPAAFPARDPRYDYYTGHPDMTDTGGAPMTLPGYGPNTRTIMQITVSGTASASFDLAKLQAAFGPSVDAQGNRVPGVFEASQHPIVVGQAAYNGVYDKKTFRAVAPRDGIARISDTKLTFDTVSGVTLTEFPLQPKAIQDEMGEAFDHDYGRMSGNLGLEAPNANALAQNLILYPYVNPASEILDGVMDASPIQTMNDGTQIWKITHNGVDTHPIHFHLFDVQLINRVGWDGIIRKPDANELGWKDTVRVSPLEDTIVAVRPVIPKIPFGVPESVRPLNPMMPLGSTDTFVNTDANANPINPPIENVLTNFGWEYVWHCHILSHEEMDMMRPISVNVPTQPPTPPVISIVNADSAQRVQAFAANRALLAAVAAPAAPQPQGVNLVWSDPTPVDYTSPATWGHPASEIGYTIERADVDSNGVVGAYEAIGTALANQTSYTDTTAVSGQKYSYRLVVRNAAGEAPSEGKEETPLGVIVAVPSSLAFSPQLVNKPSAVLKVTLTNAGNAILPSVNVEIAGTEAGDFGQSSNCAGALAVAGSCQVDVVFTPSAEGIRNAKVVVTADSLSTPYEIPLSGQGTAFEVTAAPTSLSFAPQITGTSSATKTITLSNTGTQDLANTAITVGGANAADFSKTSNCGATLAVGASCQVDVVFTPTTGGSRSASVIVAADSLNPVEVGISGEGLVAQVTAAPVSVTFAPQITGSASAAQSVTVSNSGTAVLNNLSLSVVGADAGDFTQTSTCGATLAVGASCLVDLVFTPSAGGTRSANVIVAADALTPYQVGLSGEGLVAAITAAPASVAFAPQIAGTASTAHSITLSNSGTAALANLSVSVSGTNGADFTQTNNCGAALAVSAACQLDVTFKPAGGGSRSAKILVGATGLTPYEVALSGEALVAEVTASPLSVSFAPQITGSASAAQSVTVSNSGTAVLNNLSLSVVGADAGDFTQTSTCGATLAVGASCQIDLVFKPAAGGTRNGKVVVVADALTPYEIALSGDALVAQLTPSPLSVTFTPQVVATASAAQSVTVSNTGTAVLTNLAVSISGANAADFTQTSNCGTSIAPGATCQVGVAFKPTVSGARTGKIVIAANGLSAAYEIALAGTGNDLRVSGTTSATVASGGVATYPLTVAAEGALAGTVTLACSGVPQNATCQVTPNSVTLAAAQSANVSVTIQTSQTIVAMWHSAPVYFAGVGLIGLLLLIPGTALRKRLTRELGSIRMLITLVAITIVMSGMIACGGGGGSKTPSTTVAKVAPGTYNVTVTATSGSLSRETKLTLTVQ